MVTQAFTECVVRNGFVRLRKVCCQGVTFQYNHETLQWRHNLRDSVSNHQPHECLLNRLFRRRSKNISKLRITGLCAGNSQITGEFPAQMVSNAENVFIWWRHHECYAQIVTTFCLATFCSSVNDNVHSAHFTNDFYIIIQIKGKFRLHILQFLIQWPLHIFTVHGNKAVMVCTKPCRNLIDLHRIMIKRKYYPIWLHAKVVILYEEHNGWYYRIVPS